MIDSAHPSRTAHDEDAEDAPPSACSALALAGVAAMPAPSARSWASTTSQACWPTSTPASPWRRPTPRSRPRTPSRTRCVGQVRTPSSLVNHAASSRRTCRQGRDHRGTRLLETNKSLYKLSSTDELEVATPARSPGRTRRTRSCSAGHRRLPPPMRRLDQPAEGGRSWNVVYASSTLPARRRSTRCGSPPRRSLRRQRVRRDVSVPSSMPSGASAARVQAKASRRPGVRKWPSPPASTCARRLRGHRDVESAPRTSVPHIVDAETATCYAPEPTDNASTTPSDVFPRATDTSITSTRNYPSPRASPALFPAPAASSSASRSSPTRLPRSDKTQTNQPPSRHATTPRRSVPGRAYSRTRSAHAYYRYPWTNTWFTTKCTLPCSPSGTTSTPRSRTFSPCTTGCTTSPTISASPSTAGTPSTINFGTGGLGADPVLGHAQASARGAPTCRPQRQPDTRPDGVTRSPTCISATAPGLVLRTLRGRRLRHVGDRPRDTHAISSRMIGGPTRGNGRPAGIMNESTVRPVLLGAPLRVQLPPRGRHARSSPAPSSPATLTRASATTTCPSTR